MINTQILVTSINKQIEKSKVYGNLNLLVVYFFNLVRYYINFTDGKEEFTEENKCLKELLNALKYKYPDEICNYKVELDFKDNVVNNPPSIDSNTLDLNGDFIYDIKINELLNNYTDAENDDYFQAIIYPNNLNKGKLYLNNKLIDKTTTINLVSNNQFEKFDFNLKYVVSSGDLFSVLNVLEINKQEILDSFDVRVCDNFYPEGSALQQSKFSDKVTINLTNSVYVENEPANISDIFIISNNRVETTLNLNTFTNLMSPPYNDPENDDIDAIRVDSISPSNSGTFLFNGIAIQPGDIVSDTELINGDFKHIGPNLDSLNTDTLQFSARDKGSLIWVQ